MRFSVEVITTLPIVIRLARKKDIAFITSSWLKSYRDSEAVRGVPNGVYYRLHHKVLETVIPRSIVAVAVSQDDPDQIIGWVCAERHGNILTIHYVYVKYMFRRHGVAKKLVQLLVDTEKAEVLLCTHRTHVVGHEEKDEKSILERHEILYNPYALFMSLPEQWHAEAPEAD